MTSLGTLWAQRSECDVHTLMPASKEDGGWRDPESNRPDDVPGRGTDAKAANDGETRNRTGDTTIFSRVNLHVRKWSFAGEIRVRELRSWSPISPEFADLSAVSGPVNRVTGPKAQMPISESLSTCQMLSAERDATADPVDSRLGNEVVTRGCQSLHAGRYGRCC
jgi:hypothetical protein